MRRCIHIIRISKFSIIKHRFYLRVINAFVHCMRCICFSIRSIIDDIIYYYTVVMKIWIIKTYIIFLIFLLYLIYF
nr:MAG TPA_asm: hypothetical protein [Caudoviricetes sp.]